MANLLHHQALDALLNEVTSPQRFRSRSQLASECGMTLSTLSMAAKGDRGLSDKALASLVEVTGWSGDALLLPVRARPGDIETARMVAELRRLREGVSDALLRGTDNVAEAIRQRNGG